VDESVQDDSDEKKEVIRATKTWLARLHKVKTVVVDDLPEEDGRTMKE
jgi:hypothetical protein